MTEIPEIPEFKQEKAPRRRVRARKTRTPETPALEKSLRTIYSGADGKMPDLTRLTVVRERRLRRVLAITAVFFVLAAAAAWAGIIVFKPFGRFQGGGIAFSFSNPAPLKAGEEAVVTIGYENRERVPLGKVAVAVNLPPELAYVRADPEPAEGRRWMLGNIAAKGSGEIKLAVLVRAPPGKEVSIGVFANYVPGNFNSEFQSVGSYRAAVEESALAISIDAPDDANQGDEVSWSVTYQNTGSQPLEKLVLRAEPSAHFKWIGAEPAPTSENALWHIDALSAGAKGTLTIRGAFTSEARGAEEFAVTGGWRADDGTLAALAEARRTINVLGGELKITRIVNGSPDPQSLNFGDTVRISLVYANQGTVPLKDVAFAMVFDPAPVQSETSIIDWDTLVDEKNGKRDGNRIRWTRRVIPGLRELAPGAEGVIDLVVGLRDKPFTLDSRDYRIALSVESTVGAIGGKKVNRTVASSPLVFPLNSDAAFAAVARYYNDDEIPVGTGPLPPKVGEATTFRIFWKVANSLHELKNLRISAALPDGVNWTNKMNVSAGEITYDPVGRNVIWTLNRMPDTVPSVTADFEVSVIPSVSQVGAVLPLLGQTTLDADDSVAQSHLTRSAPAADSSLEGDPIAEGRGTVTK